jgi:hypothetical protein
MIMTQEERITYYEKILDRTADAIRNLEAALDEYEAICPLLQELERYYTGPEWKADFDADAADALPQDLKRGVLSEDGIDDVLSDFRDLEDRLTGLKVQKL